MFAMTGLKNGKPYSIQMDGLQLSGDKPMISIILAAARTDQGILGIVPNEEHKGKYLNNECSAAHLARLCFDKELTFSNDWYDDAPADAIF
jgi:hypothetical protein